MLLLQTVSLEDVKVLLHLKIVIAHQDLKTGQVITLKAIHQAVVEIVVEPVVRLETEVAVAVAAGEEDKFVALY